MKLTHTIPLLFICCLCACSSDDDGGAGVDGLNAFPTTDVQGGDNGLAADVFADTESTDQTGTDGGSVGDTTGVPDTTADLPPLEDVVNGEDVPLAPDTGVLDAGQEDAQAADAGAEDTGGPPSGESGDLLCPGADPWTGKGVAFKGLQYTAPTNQAYNFTCTSCPGGISGLEGTYRWISDKWDVLPNTPQTFQAADVDTINFDGNWFTISRRDLTTGKIDTASGYYFCPDKGELGFAKLGYFNTVWYFDSIQGTTMFNTKPGTVNPVHIGGDLDVIETQGAPNWNPNSGGICPGPDCLVYCRVGSTVDGIPCTAPW